MATITDKALATYRDQARKLRDKGKELNQLMSTAKMAGGVGGLVGGAAAGALIGRKAVGEYGEDKLGMDVTPVVGLGVAVGGYFLEGALGVLVTSAGGSITGGFIGMEMALKRAKLHAAFRAATLGAKK